MPSLYARKSVGGNWDVINDETPEDATFPADVLADVLEGKNEVSVWEVAQAANQKELEAQDIGPALNTLAAALHSEHAHDLSDVSLRLVSDFGIKRLGLSMRQELGTSVDTGLNKSGNHWIIQVNTAGDAMKLAKLFKRREPCFFSKEEVLRLFATSLQQKRISTDRISSGLWKKLLDGGYLQILAKP
jgi:hypothetical protein